MASVKEKLREMGYSGNAKVVDMIEDAVSEMSDEEVQKMGFDTIEERRRRLQEVVGKAEYCVNRLSCENTKANRLIEELTTGIVLNDESKQAAGLYKSVLETTFAVCGEHISDEIICTAIQAASYGMWRAIMGESKPLFESGKPIKSKRL